MIQTTHLSREGFRSAWTSTVMEKDLSKYLEKVRLMNEEERDEAVRVFAVMKDAFLINVMYGRQFCSSNDASFDREYLTSVRDDLQICDGKLSTSSAVPLILAHASSMMMTSRWGICSMDVSDSWRESLVWSCSGSLGDDITVLEKWKRSDFHKSYVTDHPCSRMVVSLMLEQQMFRVSDEIREDIHRARHREDIDILFITLRKEKEEVRRGCDRQLGHLEKYVKDVARWNQSGCSQVTDADVRLNEFGTRFSCVRSKITNEESSTDESVEGEDDEDDRSHGWCRRL